MRQTKFTTAELKKDLLQVPIQHIVSVLWIAYTLRTLGAALSNSKIRIVFRTSHEGGSWHSKRQPRTKCLKCSWRENNIQRFQIISRLNGIFQKQLIRWQSNTTLNNAICRSILFWERRVAFCNAMLDFRRTMNLWEQHAFFVPSTSHSPSKKW